MLQISCFSLHKELAVLKGKIQSICGLPLYLSGSGSAMFCLFDKKDFEKVKEWQLILKEKLGCKSIIVSNNRW